MKRVYEKKAKDKLIGSSHRGSIDVSYYRLVELFGEPNKVNSGDGKSRYEWILEHNGYFFSIYDWKENKPINEVTQFQIGGHEPSYFFMENLVKTILYKK